MQGHEGHRCLLPAGNIALMPRVLFSLDCLGEFLESLSQSHGLNSLGLGGGRSLVTPAFFKLLYPPVARLQKQGLQDLHDLSLISWSCLLRCLQPFPRQWLNRPTWLLSPPVALGHTNISVLENSRAGQAGLPQHREGGQDHQGCWWL